MSNPFGPPGDLLIPGLFGGGPSRRGGSVELNPDSSRHTINWANWGEGDKGARMSWDTGPKGEISRVHGIDQNTGKPL